ncbi:dihydroneopterin aldolase [Thermincola ferriacetica]|uniref:7,8-dihydroneopterin aldolase n=1 Tax=Thermincola ferriacetica TaxID=281456 RepID=A0A0L6W0E3_9FIRM|nr:dihydroneopterin aldolase [Thermincola ferriacetica]KNZ68873.1 dihydroneopterin aldolase [Thermincola ferriacetica]
MGDKIILKGMQFHGRHGVFPGEKAMGQKFVVDLELSADLKKAGQTDDLAHTLNYADIYGLVKGIVTGKSFNLLEALAENIAQAILQNYQVKKVKVRVEKPQAPISGIFDYMAVEIKREKH